MTSDATTVEAYLSEIPGDEGRYVEGLLKVVRTHLSKGFQEGMNYGMIGFVVPHLLPR